MPEMDADLLLEQASLLGLITSNQAFEAKAEAEDGSLDAVSRTLLRKGWMTSWQIDRLQKGDATGFFYGSNKVIFHLAEGTFARVYRGERVQGKIPVAIKVLRQRFIADAKAVQRFHKEAEISVRMTYFPPGHKKFEVLSEKGSSTLRQKVLKPMLDAEEEAGRDDVRPHTRIVAANYDFKLLGVEIQQGRRAYLLEVAPKTRNKFLIGGRVWIDAENFGIMRQT